MDTIQRTDNELIRTFKQGGAEAFRLLYTRYKDRAFFFALALTGHDEGAEEVVQDAFMAFLKNVGSYRPLGSFKGYLFAAVRSRAIDWIRKEKLHRDLGKRNGLDLFENPLNVDSHEAGSELRGAVSRALFALPGEQREVVVLKFYDNMTFNEIAQVIGVNENTVASRYRYGKEKLKEKLKGVVKDGRSGT